MDITPLTAVQAWDLATILPAIVAGLVFFLAAAAHVRSGAWRVPAPPDQRFRQIFEFSPDAIFLVDPHHPSGTWPIVDCNAAATSSSGFTRAELTGRSLDALRARPTGNDED